MRKHISSILAFVALCCVCTDSAFAAHGSVWPLQKRIDEIAAKAGVLNGEYKAAVEKAYAALVARLDEYGNLPDVCVGTGWKNDRRHYLTRPRCIGDPHGQAPLLWLCSALMRTE